MNDIDGVLRIRTPEDVTEDHITDALDMRDGAYGGQRLTWADVIEKLEGYGATDWGDELDSPAIRHLRREVNRRQRESV